MIHTEHVPEGWNAPYSQDELRELYREYVLAEIAVLFDITLWQVYRDMIAAGIERNPPGRRPNLPIPNKEELAQLIKDHPERELAEMLEVSRRTIQRWRDEYEIPPGRERGGGWRKKA